MPGLGSPFRRVGDLLFGYDFFVSYAHSDGEAYPRALADRLQEKGFRVFLDSRVYVAGDDLRVATQRRIRMSKYLVVIVGSHALESAWVRIEVERCLDAGRVPIAINLDGALEAAEPDNALAELLRDKIFIADRTDDAQEPHDDVLARLMASFKATRQDLVRTRALASAALVLLAALAGLGWFYLVSQQEARRAREQQSLRFVADADRQLFQNPQEALLLAAQGLATGSTERAVEAGREAVQRALDVIDERQKIQRETHWGENLWLSFVAGAWFESSLDARYDRSGSRLLLTTERGASGPDPPGDAILLDTQTLESTLLAIGPAWGTRARGPGSLASFRVRDDAEPGRIPFTCTAHPFEGVRPDDVLVIDPAGSSEVTLRAGEGWPHWESAARSGTVIAVRPGARVVFEVAEGEHGLTFVDREQVESALVREPGGEPLRLQKRPGKPEPDRRLEYVGFSETGERVYLSRQHHIEVYRLDGSFEQRFKGGRGCSKDPISLVTGVLGDRMLIFGDTDGGLYRIDAESGDCAHLDREPGRILIRLDANASADRAVLVFRDQTAGILPLEPGIGWRSLEMLPIEQLSTASFQPGSDDRLLVARSDGRVARWQDGDGGWRESDVYQEAGEAVGFAAFTDDGARIVAVDAGGRLLVWDTETGALETQRAFEVRAGEPPAPDP